MNDKSHDNARDSARDNARDSARDSARDILTLTFLKSMNVAGMCYRIV